MAKLCDLPSCFMEAFLKANPNSLVDSNGYLRSEYEAEIARRKQPVAESNSVPDPRTYRPQFECTGEAALSAFESPDEQLGIVPAELDLPPAKLADMGAHWQRAMDTPPLTIEGITEMLATPPASDIAPDVTAQDLGVNESPVEAEPEVKEDLAADTVYISEHELPEPESEPQA